MRILVAVALALALLACDKSQTTTSIRKTDTLSSDAAKNPFVAAGWKSGDGASWEAQMRSRAAGQNEYARVSPRQ